MRWKDFIADPARFLMLDNRTLALGNHGSPKASGMTEASPLAGSGLASRSSPEGLPQRRGELLPSPGGEGQRAAGAVFGVPN